MKHETYSCVMQFKPYVERSDFVNVGVVLFDVSTKTIVSRTIECDDLVYERFPELVQDGRLSSERRAFINRLNDAAFDSRERIETFIGGEVGRLRLTSPKVVRCEGHTAQCLDDLYAQYVDLTTDI